LGISGGGVGDHAVAGGASDHDAIIDLLSTLPVDVAVANLKARASKFQPISDFHPTRCPIHPLLLYQLALILSLSMQPVQPVYFWVW
jgi:hypothetical protein